MFLEYYHAPLFGPVPSETSPLYFSLDSESEIPWSFWSSDGNLYYFMLLNICRYFHFFFSSYFNGIEGGKR